MSIRTYRVGAAQLDELVRRIDEEWADEVHKQPGFVSYYVVATGPEEVTSMTTFLEEDDLAVVVLKSAEWVGAHLMDLDVTLQAERRGPVVSHVG